MAIDTEERLLATLDRSPQSGDPEALIIEARDRQRRRRRRTFAIVVAAAATGALAFGIIRAASEGRSAIVHPPHGPTVGVKAFARHGNLAFISRGTLWLLDGSNGRLRKLASPPGFTPSQPTFSPDGKWLAYLEQHSTPSSLMSRLWLARADGSGAHAVPGYPTDTLIGWRPAPTPSGSDLLAVSTGPERHHQPCPCYSPTTLRVISPDGSSHIVARAAWIYGGTWSPDGQSIAVAQIERTVSSIVVHFVGRGSAKVWLRRTARQRFNGMNGVLFDIAGWWPGLGIGFWGFGDGSIHNNDATLLNVVRTPGAPPRTLGPTLSDGTTDQVAASRLGGIAVVADHGGGRSAWQDKSIKLCDVAAGSCRELPHPTGTVTVDPSWSPDGRTLAYVIAPNVRTGPWTQSNLARWFAAHRVFLYDAATHTTRELRAARGATAITWSSDGGSLLYVRQNALWLLPELTGRPERIATPLFQPGNWPQYYAQIAWADQFAWRS